MSFVLECPNCGPREVTDFAYGGELSARPTEAPSFRSLNTYNYFRRNVAGIQREWWCHRSGCRAWFVAERDTTTNRVRFTALPGDVPPADGVGAPAGATDPAPPGGVPAADPASGTGGAAA
jgi:heterotetrameric sarcosine oxidase delta subunit